MTYKGTADSRPDMESAWNSNLNEPEQMETNFIVGASFQVWKPLFGAYI